MTTYRLSDEDSMTVEDWLASYNDTTARGLNIGPERIAMILERSRVEDHGDRLLTFDEAEALERPERPLPPLLRSVALPCRDAGA